MSWTAIAVLVVGAFGFKALGLVGLGSRATSPRALALAALLPAALLPALVVVNTFAGDRALVLDARAAGMAVALVAAWRRAPFIVVVLLAAVTTALVRLL